MLFQDHPKWVEHFQQAGFCWSVGLVFFSFLSEGRNGPKTETGGVRRFEMLRRRYTHPDFHRRLLADRLGHRLL